MESAITIELGVAGATVVAAAILGYRGQKGMGAAMLGLGALLASGLCIAGTWLGLRLWENTGGWIGLVVGILLAGVLAWQAGNKVIRGQRQVGEKTVKDQSGRFAAGLWFGFCALCILGYLAGGWIGLLTITLPSLVIFWIGLHRISAYILPLRDKAKQRRQAFRTLLTFTMGTNYPYYFIKDGKPEKRVDGNPYNQFFAGPGLVYTDCDHAAYVTDGIRVKGVFDPGLNFTGMFDLEPKALDLRSQLRAFDVHALTKDGIPIKVLVFAPFRLHSGNPEAEPELGKSFPFRRRAVFEIVAAELIERRRQKEAGGERHKWDQSLVRVVVTPIVQDIISRYTVDELCAPLDPDRDPRVEIADEMRKRVRKTLLPLGIELIGGGISNLLPQDETVEKRRIDNWKTEWERRILVLMSKGKAERARQIEEARAKAELKIILRFAQVVRSSTQDDVASQTALALRFIDCIGEIVSESETQWPLPESIDQTLKRLRGEIEEGTR